MNVVNNYRDKIKLLNQLKNNVKSYDRLIKYNKVYNAKNALIRGTIDVGYYVDCVIPIVLSFYGMFMLFPNGHKPFALDDKVVYAYERVIDNSLGEHKVDYRFDSPYEDRLDYYTSWKYNNNMYERDVITYSINDFNFDSSEVLYMSQEELDNIFDVSGVITFCESELSFEDYRFSSDFVQITKGGVSDSIVKNSKESKLVNIFYTTGYLFLSFSLSAFLFFMQKYFFRDFSYGDLKLKFKPIGKKDILAIKKIRKLEKENLSLLTDDESVKIKIKKRGD